MRGPLAANDLDDLAGAMIRDQQASVGSLCQTQRVLEAAREVGDLTDFLTEWRGEHHSDHSPSGGPACVCAPLCDKGTVSVIAATLVPLIKEDSIC